MEAAIKLDRNQLWTPEENDAFLAAAFALGQPGASRRGTSLDEPPPYRRGSASSAFTIRKYSLLV